MLQTSESKQDEDAQNNEKKINVSQLFPSSGNKDGWSHKCCSADNRHARILNQAYLSRV